MEPLIRTISLSQWNCTLTVIVTDDGSYCVVREICGVLGIKNIQYQQERLNGHPVIAPYMRQWRVPSRGGMQLTWCINLKALGFWFGLVNPSLVRAEVAPKLLIFQEQILEANHRLLFGVVDSTIEAKILRLPERLGTLHEVSWPEQDDEVIPTTVSGTLHIGACPHCGERLCLEHTDSGTYLRVE